LSALAGRYHGMLDQQQAYISSLRIMVQDKDQILEDLFQETQQKEQYQSEVYHALQQEMVVQVELREELQRCVDLQNQIIHQHSAEMHETDRKLGNFKDEFV
jgi:uncharacterized protein YutE (UPF0331/DUF86 family)